VEFGHVPAISKLSIGGKFWCHGFVSRPLEHSPRRRRDGPPDRMTDGPRESTPRAAVVQCALTAIFTARSKAENDTAARAAAYRTDFCVTRRNAVDSGLCKLYSEWHSAAFSGALWTSRRSTFKPMVWSSNLRAGTTSRLELTEIPNTGALQWAHRSTRSTANPRAQYWLLGETVRPSPTSPRLRRKRSSRSARTTPMSCLAFALGSIPRTNPSPEPAVKAGCAGARWWRVWPAWNEGGCVQPGDRRRLRMDGRTRPGWSCGRFRTSRRVLTPAPASHVPSREAIDPRPRHER